MFDIITAYKKKIGFTGQLLIEPKAKEPTKHQYDYGRQCADHFLQQCMFFYCSRIRLAMRTWKPLWSCVLFTNPRRRPGTGDIETPPVHPSVCPSCLSVTFSFCTVTQKGIAVFSQNFAGMCTMLFEFCMKYWKVPLHLLV